MNIFCTLFDSNYLDKGLALYYSMEKVMPNFKLYIFAFDEKSEFQKSCLVSGLESLAKHIHSNLKILGYNFISSIKVGRAALEYCLKNDYANITQKYLEVITKNMSVN